MRKRAIVLLALSLGASGCGSPQLGGSGPPSLGRLLSEGSVYPLTLPPTQYERLHFLAVPAHTYTVVARGSSTAPLSLSLYPLIKNAAGTYDPAPRDSALRSFQRTGTLPLKAEVAIPERWNRQDPVVIELKNIGGVVSEPMVELQSRPR